MTMAMTTDPIAPALVTLETTLKALAEALASGRGDEVWAVESRVAEATEALCRVTRQRVAVGPGDRALQAQVSRIREQLVQCRRLGRTVPAVLSVMFPGRVGYGRDGHATVEKGL
jgi:hypothetical protein